MTSLNRVFLSGYLGNKPEKKTTKGGKHYYYASLASHKAWKKEDDEWEERTNWHSLFFWSPRSMRLVENLNKGQSLMVDGEIVSFEKVNEGGLTQKSSVIEVKDLKTLAK